MVKQIEFYAKDKEIEYQLILTIDLLCGDNFIIKNGNIAFHVKSYEIDEINSSLNWEDFFKITRVCKLLTIEIDDKRLKVEVNCPPKSRTTNR